MLKKTIWLSYDLGIRGDYKGLYEWLDNHEAKECGDSVGVLIYEFNNNLEELKIDGIVTFNQADFLDLCKIRKIEMVFN
jgi:hypothetical protein